MTKALVLINDISGDRVPNSVTFEGLRGRLESAGLSLDVHLLKPEDDARKLSRAALERGAGMIIVAGGDGTVSLAAAELVHSEAALGILPLGTFNNIARSLAIPLEAEAAADVLIQGKVRTIDVGRVAEGPHFFEVAGAGIDAALFPLGEEIKSGGWGRLLEFTQRTIRYRPHRVTLTFDCPVREALATSTGSRYSDRTLSGRSVRLRSLLVAVANGPYYGGGFAVAPGARLTDGKLTVAVYRNFSKLELMRHFLAIAGGQHRRSLKVETFHVQRVRIASTRPLPFHLDGVPTGEAPVELCAVPQALRVVAP